MMPSPEDRHRARTDARRRLFTPRKPEAPAAELDPAASLAAFERDVRRWWANDRRARIRAGACPDCAERCERSARPVTPPFRCVPLG